MALPEEVQRVMGFALHQAQAGEEHPAAKALRGLSGRGVLEVVERHDGDTFRAVYTVRLERSTCCTASRRRPSAASRPPRRSWT